MHIVHRSDLPHVGISHEFVGRDQGSTKISFFLITTDDPGHGVRLHKHASDEVVHVLEGESTWTIGDASVVAHPGDTVVVHADEPHAFVNTGRVPLRQIDIHLNPVFASVWLE